MAVAGKTQVVSAAHSIMGRGRNASHFVDHLGGKNLVDVSVASGVNRFIYVSAWFERRGKLNAFFASKKHVESHLRVSGLTHTIIRPTAFMDLHAEELIGARIEARQPIVVFGPGTVPRNFVAADDVAELIVKTLQDQEIKSQTITIGGPQNLSTADVIVAYEILLNRPAKTIHVPLAVASLLCWLFKPLHPGLAQIMDMTIQVERNGDAFNVQANPLYAANSSLDSWARRRLRRG